MVDSQRHDGQPVMAWPGVMAAGLVSWQQGCWTAPETWWTCHVPLSRTLSMPCRHHRLSPASPVASIACRQHRLSFRHVSSSDIFNSSGDGAKACTAASSSCAASVCKTGQTIDGRLAACAIHGQAPMTPGQAPICGQGDALVRRGASEEKRYLGAAGLLARLAHGRSCYWHPCYW